MNPETRKILLQYLKQADAKNRIELGKLCFPKQLNFIEDKCRFALAITSRRAGKTTACAMHLLHTAVLNPNSTCFYITYSRTDAKGIIWPMLHKLNRELNLGGEANEADLIFHFSNGSRIRVSGAATAGEIDRFRGYSIKLAYIDEAQRFGYYLQNLIDDVLVPACFDTRGLVRVIGTPGPVPTGYYYDASTSPKWSVHKWTLFDNPWIKDPEEVVKEELARRGVTEDDPTVQREMFGRFVTDRKKLVLHYDAGKNDYLELPVGTYSHIMGIDLGFKDADAIAILAHSNTSPVTYLLDELVVHKQGLTELFTHVEALRAKYNPYKLVIDTGGLGLKIAESMRQRYRIPVHAAEKTRKFENIELFNDALRTRRFMARKESRFAQDAMLLEWDMDKLQPDRKVVSDRYHSDIIDASLYAFRESPAYAYEPPKPQPAYGSAEWAQQEVVAMERQAFEKALEKQAVEKTEQDQWGVNWQ